MKRLCSRCDQEIPSARLEALPNTHTCVRCSTTKPYIGVSDFTSKNTSTLVLIDPDDKEMVRKAQNYQNQTRGFGVHGGWK